MSDRQFYGVVALFVAILLSLGAKLISLNSLDEPEPINGYTLVTIMYGSTGIEGYITEDSYYSVVNGRPYRTINVHDPMDFDRITEISREQIRAIWEE